MLSTQQRHTDCHTDSFSSVKTLVNVLTKLLSSGLVVPKEGDSSEDFDPIKFHFEKCCSGLAFLYRWIFSVYQTAQGRR